MNPIRRRRVQAVHLRNLLLPDDRDAFRVAATNLRRRQNESWSGRSRERVQVALYVEVRERIDDRTGPNIVLER